MKKKLMPLLTFIIMSVLFLGISLNVFATSEGEHEMIIHKPEEGYYCINYDKQGPYPPGIDMTAISSKNYTKCSQEKLHKYAASILFRDNYQTLYHTTISNSDIQQLIWAFEKDDPQKFVSSLQFDVEKRTRLTNYYNYVLEHYTDVIGKYTMKIWLSSDSFYQDILQANLVSKQEAPEVEKKVMDINDSNTNTEDNLVKGWQDSADYDIGDTIPFQLKATMGFMGGFTTYYVQFYDEMTNLTYVDGSAKITLNGKDVSDKFFVNYDTSEKKLLVTCNDVISLGAQQGSEIIVDYNATLDAAANIGSTGNPNTVKLIYSNNPDNDEKGETPIDKVIVFTYKMIVNKVDKDNHPLKGASFELFKKIMNPVTSEGTEPTVFWKSLGVKAGNEMTTFEWDGIDDGDYKIVEVVTPRGYNSIDPIEFTVSADHDYASDNPKLNSITISKEEIEGKTSDGSINVNIVNTAGAVLPSTGGMGTKIFYLFGATFVLAAGVLLVARRRVRG